MRWLRRDEEDRWVMLNRFGEVVDSVTEDDIAERPRRQRDVILRAPKDDGRHA